MKIFKDIGFGIDIQTSLKKVGFLDVTLNLQNGTKNQTTCFTSTHC